MTSKLTDIIGDAQSVKDAFGRLGDAEKSIRITVSELDNTYIPVDIREEFVILEDIHKTQYLHPYRTKIGYSLVPTE